VVRSYIKTGHDRFLPHPFQLIHTPNSRTVDQEMIPARNARNVVTLAEVMFVTIQRENILPSKITD
jgi:hypothetical protein